MVGTSQTLGVIDIGSNSGRVMVARVHGATHLDVLGDARSPLRLVRDVTRDGLLNVARDGLIRLRDCLGVTA